MDTSNGKIYESFDSAILAGAKREHLKPINTANLTKRQRALLCTGKSVKIGRNDPCPCGSQKKFKRCCMKVNG